MNNRPKYFANRSDDNHCLQAAVLMALAAEGIQMTWADVNKKTLYDPRFYSWTLAGAALLGERIPGVEFISDLDYRKFAQKGRAYYKSYADHDWYGVVAKHASKNFANEQRLAKRLLKHTRYTSRSVNAQMISKLLKNNNIIALVDSGMLAHKSWHAGHFVYLFQSTNKFFKLHDPGLPAKPNWRVSKKRFIKALTGEMIIVPKRDIANVRS